MLESIGIFASEGKRRFFVTLVAKDTPTNFLAKMQKSTQMH